MVKDLDAVKIALRKKILDGYDPSWDLESAEDHWIDWLVLSKEEFTAIKSAAKVEAQSIPRHPPT